MKKRLLSLICSASLVLCCAASGCSGSQELTKSTQKTCIGTVSGQKIYNSGRALYIIKDDNTFEYVEQKHSADDSATADNIVSSVSTFDILGYDIYGKIVEWDLSDLKNASYKELYTSDNVKSVFESVKSKYGLQCDVEELCGEALRSRFPKLCDGGDGYIYYIFVPSKEQFVQMMPVAYNIIRFAKDGSSFEFTDNKAGDLTIKDGYIYYYDGGYSYDKNDPYMGALDRSKTGIYKMKTDGSDKKQLVKLSLDARSKDLERGNVESMWFAGRLEIVNNELYYIGIDNLLYKVSLDGGEPEKVTKDKCNNYYIDTDSSTLYYVKGPFESSSYGYDVVSVPLAGGEETKLFTTTNMKSYSGMMTVDGDYLYLSNPDRYMFYNRNVKYEGGETYNDTDPCGRRWNLKKGEMEVLRSAVDVVMKRYEFGQETVVSMSEPKISWEKEEVKSTYY